MTFHEKLKFKMHQFVKEVYRVTRNFPREELYGVTAQLRKAAMSVILNYIEGYARRRRVNCKVYNNFLETSYGSLKESKYLIYFSFTEDYMNENDYNKLIEMNDEIGAMLWPLLDR